MKRLPTKINRTAPLFPYTTRFRSNPRPAQAQGPPSRAGREAGHGAVAAMEGRDQQQERRSRRRNLHPRCRHGLGRRHVAASVGGLGLDQELGRSGIGLTMAVDDTAPRRGPIALADLFDAALKDLVPKPKAAALPP